MIRAYLRQHHVGLIALLLVFLSGGSAYAAATIGAGDIKRNAVRAKHIKDGQVGGAEVNEASLDESRVVNRARGNAVQIVTTTPTNYPLTQGTSWIQAANESVFEYVGSMAFDFNGCSGANDLNISIKVDGAVVSSEDVASEGDTSPQPIAPQVFDREHTLFEPGAPTTRTFAVEVHQDQECLPGGGPIEVSDVAVNLLGVR